MGDREPRVSALGAEVGIRIRDARRAAGLRQQDLADVAGMTRSSVANLEAGRQEIPAWRLVSLAAALKTTVCALLAEHGDAALNERLRIVADIRRFADELRTGAPTTSTGLALGAIVDEVANRINVLDAAARRKARE